MTPEWRRDDRDVAGKLDAPSAWIGVHGDDFHRSLTEGAESRSDFRFIAALDAENLSRMFDTESGSPGRLSAIYEMPKDLDLRDPSLAELLRTKQNMADPRIFLLPLRQSCFPPGGPRTDLGPVFGRTGTADPPLPAADADSVKAVVGVIDFGINPLHAAFRSAIGGSRVAHHWAQDADASLDDAAGAVPYGREWRAEDLKAQLDAARGCEIDALRAMGLADRTGAALPALSRSRTHGTHVLGLATGNPRNGPPRTDLPIVTVDLPAVVARETSGTLLGLFFIHGLEFLLLRARSFGPVPVYANFSFGLSGGPRGGNHLLERAIDALVDRHRESGGGDVILALPAGNRNMARGHARRIAVDAPGTIELTWRLLPADPSSNFLDIWLTADGGTIASEVELRLVAPDGQIVQAPRNDTALRLRAARHAVGQARDTPSDASALLHADATDARPIGRAALRHDAASGNLQLSLALAPTDPRASGRTPTPPGDWRILVRSLDPDPARVDIAAWILRDDTLPHFRDPSRQSVFVDPDHPDRTETGMPSADDGAGATTRIRHGGTLNALATSGPFPRPNHARLAVGGTVLHQASNADDRIGLAPYSGRPSAASAERIAASAVCERSAAVPGVIGHGTLSGARHAMNGTSVAAPQLLRHLLETGMGLAELREFYAAHDILEVPPPSD